ncbi:MAG: EamA family transporter [Candidatus Odinarchaeia archaeon]
MEIVQYIIPSLIAILASVFFGIAAPLFKQCTSEFGVITFSEVKKDIKGFVKKTFNKYFITAAILQVFGWLIFLTALSSADVTTVAPILSFTYVVTAIYSKFILKETLNWKEILGIGLIIMGVIVLTFPF